MIRLFLAVPIPTEVKSELATAIEKVKSGLVDWKVNWVAPENLHITLIFLGWLPPEGVEPLKAEIAGALVNFPAFEISTSKLTFETRPLWFEIEKGKERLRRLQEVLGEELSIKGSYLEKRPFHAHLTIGRIKKKGRSKLPKTERSFRWKADQVVLYQSSLRKTGSVYTGLASFPLS